MSAGEIRYVKTVSNQDAACDIATNAGVAHNVRGTGRIKFAQTIAQFIQRHIDEAGRMASFVFFCSTRID